MKIADNIYYRYEKNIDNGILYIYNFDTELLIKSKNFTYQILRLIESKEDYEMQTLIIDLQKMYPNIIEEELEQLITTTITFLYNRNVII